MLTPHAYMPRRYRRPTRARAPRRATRRKTKARSFRRIARVVARVRPQDPHIIDYNDDITVGTVAVTAATVSGSTAYAYYPSLLNRISQGTEITERLSNAIRMSSMHLKMKIQQTVPTAPGDGALLNPYQMRVMVILDRQTEGDDISLNIADILQNTADDFYAMISHYNITSTRRRYKILMDRVISMPGWSVVTTFDTGDNSFNAVQNPALRDKTLSKFFPLRGMPVYYNGGAGTDISKNGIYMLIFTDNQDAATFPPVVHLTARMRFSTS